jgi:hypothetical protein
VEVFENSDGGAPERRYHLPMFGLPRSSSGLMGELSAPHTKLRSQGDHFYDSGN